MYKLEFKTVGQAVTILICSLVSVQSQAELMFSKYIDGANNRKGLEIYNPDASAVNLSGYRILQYSNGASAPGLTLNLNNVQLGPNQRYVIGRTELAQAIGSDKVQQVAALAYNGDDALVLTHSGVAVDRFGRVGEQPIGGWGPDDNNKKSIGNSFLRKEQSNSTTSIDPTAVFDLKASWLSLADRNDFSVLGSSITTPSSQLSCSSESTPIADLQNAALNQVYTVQGVLTADYRYSNGFNGFYIQTPDNQAVNGRSNGLFVYIPAGSTVTGGVAGDVITVRGTLQRNQGQLQLTSLQSNVLTCATGGNSLIAPRQLKLPFDSVKEASANSPALYSGMLVSLPQTLTVSENYNYGRYGELALSNGRLFIPTMLYAPGSVEAKQYAANNQLNKIILDDGFSNQNRTPLYPANFSAVNTLRNGYQVSHVTGILEYRFGQWRIQPISGQVPASFDSSANPRTEAPARAKGSNIRIASFNVLNYDNGVSGFPTSRGATTQAEFEKQHAKIVSAMKAIDADVFALMEVANNGYGDNSAIAYLSRALGSDWAYIKPETGDRLGGDVISVGIIYNKRTVRPVGKSATLDLGHRNRSVIAQNFLPLKGGHIITVVPTHLKSKGCGEIEPDDVGGMLNDDQGDGQSCWVPTRVDGVQKITDWLAHEPALSRSDKVIVLGDFNSYAKEDPIRAMEQRQFTNLAADSKIGVGPYAYSYVYGVTSDANGYGGAGTLDYSFASKALLPYVKRAQEWHINADEPTVLDYNEEYKSADQIGQFYAADPYRSSDHDPMVVDLMIGPGSQAIVNTSTMDMPDSVEESAGWWDTFIQWLDKLFSSK